MLALLDHAYAPYLMVKALAEVGLTASDLAVAVGSNVRTASSWLDDEKGAPKKKSHQERLRELKELVCFMVHDGTIAYQEADWLRHPNRSADFETPLQLIARGELTTAAYVYGDDVAAKIPEELLPRAERREGAKERLRRRARTSR